MRPSAALCDAAPGLALVHPGKNSRFAFAVGLAMVTVAAVGLGLIAAGRFPSEVEMLRPLSINRHHECCSTSAFSRQANANLGRSICPCAHLGAHAVSRPVCRNCEAFDPGPMIAADVR
jgi:hypothetical protein